MNFSNHINVLLLSLMLLSVPCAHADIIDANQAYKAQNYESAFTQFLELAQLGSNQAKYNVAVMYFKGQGTEKNLGNAYGWAQLVDYENNDLIDLREEITKQLTATELTDAQKAADFIQNQFGQAYILSQLAPVTVSNEQQSKDSETEYQVKLLSSEAPRFPKSALEKGIHGWVNVGFDIHPDGSVRDIYVIESVPEGVFDQNTIKAIQQFKFEVKFKDDINPYPVQAKQMIEYEVIVKHAQNLSEVYDEHLYKLKNLANEGHPDAQYQYALAASSKSSINRNPIDQESVNHWLFKAAQNGNLNAQYMLGRNIISGVACLADKQKGMNWIIQAANKGHGKASRLAYRVLRKNAEFNTTGYSPEYWLKKAANHGNADAQLEYAYFLAFEQGISGSEEAKAYLKKFTNQRDKTVKYHQIMAQLHKIDGEEKKAQKELNKAEKLAKKLGWEI